MGHFDILPYLLTWNMAKYQSAGEKGVQISVEFYKKVWIEQKISKYNK